MKKNTSQSSKGTNIELATTNKLTFGRDQYIWMILGFVLILIGLALSTGGHNDDPNVFDPNVIYNKRITIAAPIIILSGLIVEIYAIFKKSNH